MRRDQVMLELLCQTLAQGDGLGRHISRRRQVGEKEEQTETIIKVTKSIDECGIALLDDMIQGHTRRIVLLNARGIADISTTERTSNLLAQSLLLAELRKQRLMEEVLDVASVVECRVWSGSLGCLLLVAWLSWIDTFYDLSDFKPPKKFNNGN